MHLVTRCTLVALSLVMAACASTTSAPATGATYIVVRHAEKGTDDPKDPALTEAGRTRADALARQFAGKPLAAAYATAYKRTQQTALPSAAASGIGVTTYDAAGPTTEFAAGLRRDHPRGSVLVVGHSNTVPDIVSALCACPVAPLGDTDYGRLFEVNVDGAGRATLVERTY